MPSRSAKAAAVLVFTSGVEDFDMAVSIYDEIFDSSEDELDTVLDKHRAFRWSPVEHLSPADWWDEVMMLATSIDASRDHFKE